MNKKIFFGKTLLAFIVMGHAQIDAFSAGQYSEVSQITKQMEENGDFKKVSRTIRNANGLETEIIHEQTWSKDGTFINMEKSINLSQKTQIILKEIHYPDGSKTSKETIVKADGSTIVNEVKTDKDGRKTLTTASDKDRGDHSDHEPNDRQPDCQRGRPEGSPKQHDIREKIHGLLNGMKTLLQGKSSSTQEADLGQEETPAPESPAPAVAENLLNLPGFQGLLALLGAIQQG